MFTLDVLLLFVLYFFFFKQKTAYEMRISDWSSDVCSSDLTVVGSVNQGGGVAFNSDWLKDNGGAQLLKAIDDVWNTTDDSQIAKKLQSDILKKTLGDHATVALTGVDVVPPTLGGDKLSDLLGQLTSALAGR